MIRKEFSCFCYNNFYDSLLGKYGFTNRAIDGISLTITNLTFAVKGQGFKASIFVC